VTSVGKTLSSSIETPLGVTLVVDGDTDAKVVGGAGGAGAAVVVGSGIVVVVGATRVMPGSLRIDGSRRYCAADIG
jgi:hypothetical protein